MAVGSSTFNAVNRMLAAINEAPIESPSGSLPGTLPDTLTADAQEAVSVLDETSVDVQSTGWWFNTLREQVLTPLTGGGLGEGFIDLGFSTLRVELDPRTLGDTLPTIGYVSYYFTNDFTGAVQIVRPVLFDQKNNTYIFTKPVTASRLIRKLGLEELPPAAYRYILIRATRKFVEHVLPGEPIHSYSERDEMMAYVALQSEDLRMQKHNMLGTFNMRRS